MNNVIELCGSIADKPRFSHMGGNDNYFTFPLDIERLSGYVDGQHHRAAGYAGKLEIEDCRRLAVIGGCVLSTTARRGKPADHQRFAKEVFYRRRQKQRLIDGCGMQKPIRNADGRQICDIMLAVNQRYGRSDYLPCIATGRLAERTSELKVGDTISLEGGWRYIKTVGGVMTERTALKCRCDDSSVGTTFRII